MYIPKEKIIDIAYKDGGRLLKSEAKSSVSPPGGQLQYRELTPPPSC